MAKDDKKDKPETFKVMDTYLSPALSGELVDGKQGKYASIVMHDWYSGLNPILAQDPLILGALRTELGGLEQTGGIGIGPGTFNEARQMYQGKFEAAMRETKVKDFVDYVAGKGYDTADIPQEISDLVKKYADKEIKSFYDEKGKLRKDLTDDEKRVLAAVDLLRNQLFMGQEFPKAIKRVETRNTKLGLESLIQPKEAKKK